MTRRTLAPDALCLSRRHLIGGAAASLALWGLVPRTASAAGSGNPRLLTVVLRGGLDGIAMIAPAGDPDYQRLRGPLAIPASGANAGLRLDGTFVLNANMPFLAALYQRGEALALHAVATPYRGRSHFDGQDVLESGLAGVGRIEDGWLNRALAGLPGAPLPVAGKQAAGSAAATAGGPRKGLAMGAVVPLVMRGKAPVLSWIPKTFNLPLRESTVARLNDLYAQVDPRLAKAFADGVEIEQLASAGMSMPAPAGAAAPQPRPGPVVEAVTKGAAEQKAAAQAATPTPAPATPAAVAPDAMAATPAQAAPPAQRPFRDFLDTAEAAAKFLAAPDGPRIGALSYGGWDTHANAGVHQGVLGNRLAGLDAAIRALHDGLGSAWRETIVVIVTEFGRTARANGTEGTDHGTGMAALVVGGAVRGGRVIADWPGLADASLFEGRDLKPTLDLRAPLKGILRDHLAIPEGALGDTIFPDSRAVKPTADLVRRA